MKLKFNIRFKLYVFISIMVFIAIMGTGIIVYAISSRQSDMYFKKLSLNTARIASKYVDKDFIRELRDVATSKEYQYLRDQAEDRKNEDLVIEYFKQKGLWDKYQEQRDLLREFVDTIEDVKYLYVIKCSGPSDHLDMYILDADDVEVYETGYYEEREEDFVNTDFSKEVEPIINNGDWGWLCSGYVPIYDGDELIAQIGCDIDMEDIMSARFTIIHDVIKITIVYTLIVVILAFLFVKKSVIIPIRLILTKMKEFSPAPDLSYTESKVICLPSLKSNDEIYDVYNGIRNMQMKIQDYITDITNITINREQIENRIKDKNVVIGQIKELAYKDKLTGVNNSTAYAKKVEELEEQMKSDKRKFSIVMIDINNLKIINDNHGHDKGDIYLKGCCHIICEIFKHSPVFRVGGDEFVVVAQNEDYENRVERTQDLKIAFKNSFETTDNDPWTRYSASIGISDCTNEDIQVEQIFKRADKEMYENKRKFKESLKHNQ